MLAWATSSSTLRFTESSSTTIDGRDVSIFQDPFDNTPPIYAFRIKDVVFMVQGAPAPPDPAKPTGLVAELLSRLP